MKRSPLIGVADAATALGISVRRVQHLILAGRLPAQKIGRSYIIQRADLAKVRHRKPGRPWPKK